MESEEKKNGGDIQENLSQYSRYIQGFSKTKYGELDLPRKNYCGPLTRLDIRLDDQNQPIGSDNEPVDGLDQACYRHDLAYRSQDLRDRHLAAVNLIHDTNNLEDLSLRNRFERFLINIIMKSKIVFGGQLDKPDKKLKQLAKELYRQHRRNKVFLKIQVEKLNHIWSVDLIFLTVDQGSDKSILKTRKIRKK